MGDEPGDERDYYTEIRRLLKEAYLGADDPRAQSGFRGDEARWELARHPIVEAIHRDGSFLDIGCANGLLLESVVRWANKRGVEIEPHGLDLIESVANLARERLPEWSDLIHTGNVMHWKPPQRFDFVRTELQYAPPEKQKALIEKLFGDFTSSGGRVIVCSYGSSRRPEPKAELIGDILRNWGYEVRGEAEAAEANGVVITRVAWMDTP